MTTAALPAFGREFWMSVLIALGAIGVALLDPTLAIALLLFATLFSMACRDVHAAVATVIVVAPWTTLTNSLLGGRFVPVGADAFVLSAALLLPATIPRPWVLDRASRLSLHATLACVAIAILQIFNPRGLGIVGGAEGFRAFAMPMLALPLGLAIGRLRPASESALVRAILLASGLVAIMGIRQSIAISNLDMAIIEHAKSDYLPFLITGTNRLRAFSPLPGPFHFGLLMTEALLIVVAFLQEGRLRFMALVALFLAALALNATRLNWLGCAVGLAVMVALSIEPKRLARWISRLLAALTVGAGVLWLLARAGFTVLERFAAAFFTNPTANTSYVYRVLGWVEDIIPAIKRAPLAGYGTGMAKDGLGPYTSHNILFKVLIEGGGLLFIPYIVAISALAVALYQRRKRPVARATLAIIAAVHAAGMFGPMLDTYPANLYFWLVAGLACAALPDKESPLMALPRQAV